jgi:hypothetical protein
MEDRIRIYMDKSELGLPAAVGEREGSCGTALTPERAISGSSSIFHAFTQPQPLCCLFRPRGGEAPESPWFERPVLEAIQEMNEGPLMRKFELALHLNQCGEL